MTRARHSNAMCVAIDSPESTICKDISRMFTKGDTFDLIDYRATMSLACFLCSMIAMAGSSMNSNHGQFEYFQIKSIRMMNNRICSRFSSNFGLYFFYFSKFLLFSNSPLTNQILTIFQVSRLEVIRFGQKPASRIHASRDVVDNISVVRR